jgi:hypothetical protein
MGRGLKLTYPPQNSLTYCLINTNIWRRHLRISIALGTFAVCRTENVLHENEIPTLAEIRENQ